MNVMNAVRKAELDAQGMAGAKYAVEVTNKLFTKPSPLKWCKTLDEVAEWTTYFAWLNGNRTEAGKYTCTMHEVE